MTDENPYIIIFGGLPGVGKSTIAAKLAIELNAAYLRIDSVEQSIKNSWLKVEDAQNAGYEVGYSLAVDNLENGMNVVADSVNSIEITRNAWVEVAKKSQANYFQVEIICSDQLIHRDRVENRDVGIQNLVQPNWNQVISREYEVWKGVDLIVDSSKNTPEESVNKI